MSTDEYAPSEDEMREAYVWLSAGDNEGAREQATEDFNRGLARFRRDAKAEAWDEGYGKGSSPYPFVQHNPYREKED